MRKILPLILFTATFLLISQPVSAKIVINEILPNPAGRDRGNEWVELYNNSTENINLTGWKIQKKKLNGIILAKSYKIIQVALRNKDNLVRLAAPFGIVDEIYYKEAFEGLALTREKHWLPATPNAPNPTIKIKKISPNELISKLLSKPDPYTIFQATTQIPAQKKESLPLAPLLLTAILLSALHYKSSLPHRHE